MHIRNTYTKNFDVKIYGEKTTRKPKVQMRRYHPGNKEYRYDDTLASDHV
jgi:hypothetical protein